MVGIAKRKRNRSNIPSAFRGNHVSTLIGESLKTLANYTSPALLVPELKSNTATGVIAELCSLLQQQGRLSDCKEVCDAVITRELLSPTSIPPGWALPHARLKGLAQISFALARSPQPLVWFGEGGIRPQLVFLFVIPEAEAKTYLNLISALARLSQDPTLLGQLRFARDSETMFSVLEQIPLLMRGAISSFTAQASETQ
jgi:mannitol/fructose-specific phosphotransferase system IIA component (Ntr-type)